MYHDRTIRRLHRWLSLGFTLGVVANLIAMTGGQPPIWVGMLALVPLLLLMASGLYLYARPHMAARGAAE